MYREALALEREVFGERHVNSLRTMEQLAEVLERQGKSSEAAALVGEAKRLREESPTATSRDLD